ncbi:MAG TPA: hypothetical protein DCE56_32395 [Cyanobacteria bacterium UBA8553]|nr:hypothetical protein [Cyanobacteria bacterium UBA8553]HAJ58390.1 hypothetical protein [Cyanobacteria bacterium UBA8543]
MARLTITALLTVTAVPTLWQLPSLSQATRYVSVGIDEFNKATVYLDRQSIKKTGQTSYKYTIFSSNQPITEKKERFEEDIVVNCNKMNSIVHLGSRLYDATGRLVKTDPPPGTQDVSSSSGSTTYRNANRIVCKRGR